MAPPHARAAVSSVEMGYEVIKDQDGNETLHTYVKKLRLWDKNVAMEKLMKFLGIFEQSGSSTQGGIPEFSALAPKVQQLVMEKLKEMADKGTSH